MSEPKRVNFSAVIVHHIGGEKEAMLRMYFENDGMFVSYEDYARLKAEVERLRKAGDAMADAIYEADPEKLEAHKKFKLTDEEYNAVQLWRAAKEGKQP